MTSGVHLRRQTRPDSASVCRNGVRHHRDRGRHGCRGRFCGYHDHRAALEPTWSTVCQPWELQQEPEQPRAPWLLQPPAGDARLLRPSLWRALRAHALRVPWLQLRHGGAHVLPSAPFLRLRASPLPQLRQPLQPPVPSCGVRVPHPKYPLGAWKDHLQVRFHRRNRQTVWTRRAWEPQRVYVSSQPRRSWSDHG